jgi:hypothetical protein
MIEGLAARHDERGPSGGMLSDERLQALPHQLRCSGRNAATMTHRHRALVEVVNALRRNLTGRAEQVQL